MNYRTTTLDIFTIDKSRTYQAQTNAVTLISFNGSDLDLLANVYGTSLNITNFAFG